jgi:hypothetical protein
MFILLQSFSKKGHADVAQLVEQLICNQLVGGSNPSIGSDSGNQAGSGNKVKSSLNNCKVGNWGDTRAVKWGRL